MASADNKDCKTAAKDVPKLSRNEQLKGYAITYLKNGFVPIGLRGKVPVAGGWNKVTKDDALQILESQLASNKINNVGIVTGKSSGVVVVDIDLRENGVKNWEALIKQNGMVDTYLVITGSGGYHYYFKYDERMPSLHKGKVSGQGIDFQTDNAQVVAPGSIHPDTKKPYAVKSGYNCESATPFTIARMPDWLYTLIASHQK